MLPCLFPYVGLEVWKKGEARISSRLGRDLGSVRRIVPMRSLALEKPCPRRDQ